jgi:hypothetical protein
MVLEFGIPANYQPSPRPRKKQWNEPGGIKGYVMCVNMGIWVCSSIT